MKSKDIKEQDSYFQVMNVTNFNELKAGDVIPESDFSMLARNGQFIQFEHIEKTEPAVVVKPGLYEIDKAFGALKLSKSAFLEEPVMEKYVATAEITKAFNQFFSKIDSVYRKYKKFPKRGMLIYGKHGCGKTVAINLSCMKYLTGKDTFVLKWSTDSFDANDVSRLLKRMKYEDTVKRMIFIIEDIGGGEQDIKSARGVESSLLSLLDDQGALYKVPTMIVATTNFPEHLLEILTDRPKRFDDHLEIKPPTAQQRLELFKFFANDRDIPQEALDEIIRDKYDSFSVAHVDDIFLRAELKDLTLVEAMRQLKSQSEKVANNFQTKKGMGIGGF